MQRPGTVKDADDVHSRRDRPVWDAEFVVEMKNVHDCITNIGELVVGVSKAGNAAEKEKRGSGVLTKAELSGTLLTPRWTSCGSGRR